MRPDWRRGIDLSVEPSVVPKYVQIRERLAEAILSGQLPYGEQLPSQQEMCRQYGVALGTVRQALSELEAEGLIKTDQGRGTFVSYRPRSSWLLQASEGFHQQEVGAYGREVSSQVLAVETGVLPGWVTRALRLPPGARGVTIERVRLLDGEPVLHVLNHLPERFAEFVEVSELDRGSLYAQIEKATGLRIEEGRRSIRAVPAGEHARHLDCDPDTPLLYVESVSRSRSGQLIDAYRAWVRTDRVAIELSVGELTPLALGLDVDD